MMIGVPNPYNPHQPAGDPATFFGHNSVFAFFRQHFVGTPLDRPLIMFGRRGLGKSAVLQQLAHQLEERYRPCVVSLGALDTLTERTLIAALVEAIRRTLEQSEASTYRLPDWPTLDDSGSHMNEVRAWFRGEYLDVALSALRVRHLVLCFDDAHLLFDAIDSGALPADWPAYLVDLMTAYDRLDAVLALDSAYEGRMLTTPLLNDPARHIRLAELTRDEAEQLVRTPVAGTIAYQRDAVEAILDKAGGHPFLLQSICFLLFRRSEERKHAGPITLADLNAIQPALLDQADVIFDPLWQRATQNERMTLTALVWLSELDLAADKQDDDEDDFPDLVLEGTPYAAIYGWLTGAGYALNKTQLAAALRSLGYEGLVRAKGDRYTLATPLVADWIKANVTAPQISVPHTRRGAASRLALAGGLLTALLIAGVLAVAALSGVFGDTEEDESPAAPDGATATLALNLEGTRQSEFATQTEAARPTETFTPTRTPRPSHTPTITPTPSVTPSATATASPTATRTPRPTLTATPSPSPTTPGAPPSPSPTLHPG